MKQLKLFLGTCFLLVAGVFSGCQPDHEESHSATPLISQVKESHAPDKRVALFDITYSNDSLKGQTNLPRALGELTAKLDSAGIPYTNVVEQLPDAALEGKTHGVVTISVANIRSAPKHSAELATQATMGTPVSVLKKAGSWYLVQTPDKYISWVDAAGITLMDKNAFNQWEASPKLVFTGLLGYVYESEDKSMMVSDLTAGNLLKLLGEDRKYYQVALPDGRSGYLEKEVAMPFEEWISSRSLSDNNLISTAKNMMGVPYLWGGTSIKGVDCSGFTKTIYFLNGQVIPRDASQQVNEGELVDTEKNWDKLEVGDLLFFGRKATEDQPERIVHVGMWIGNNSFIHSRGRVRISSFDPDSPHYDEYELGRYLRTKRIRQVPSEHIIEVAKAMN
ncbi:glycoside hydrolase [Echinicola strongylocentroti]|uniref:Glycoside hydrolase n=1 Tax=Echinicola strongylocentroti TaxID=1795355 RepID=A0A2Z4IQ88_9BACT|nr:C40 family peptidase [Echinicola strongylocentroti]AWW32940.1 glycoside hydrolase [Echinicola strongylocentroti]